MSSMPMPSSTQKIMACPYLQVSTILPASVTPASGSPAQTRDICGSLAPNSFFTVVPVSVNLGGVPSSSTCAALTGRSSATPAPTSSTFSRLCAVVISAGLLPGATSNADASETATLSLQLSFARHRRDLARQEFASVWSELYQVRDGNDNLRLALALLHVLFYKFRLPTSALALRLVLLTSYPHLLTICITAWPDFSLSLLCGVFGDSVICCCSCWWFSVLKYSCNLVLHLCLPVLVCNVF